MRPPHLMRSLCLLPLVGGVILTAVGHLDPLALPVLGAASVGFASRGGAGGFDLALLAGLTAALCSPSPAVGLLGGAALLAAGASRGPRWVWLPVGLGGAAVGAAIALDPGGPLTVLHQLRLLGLAGGGLLAVGGLLASGPGPARRAAGLAAVLGLWALCRGASSGWPDGWRLASPYLVWLAPALALLGALWLIRGGRVVVAAALAPAAAALLGALSGTASGVDGAAWALAGPALVVAVADRQGALPGPWTALAAGGLPGALPAAAGGLALWAAATAIHPAPLRWAALATLIAGAAALALIAIRARGMARGPLDRWLGLGLLGLGLGFALLGFGLRPTAAGAESAAAAMEAHRLPIDDMRGWRRLSRLEAPPEPGPPDAGVGR